MQYIDAKFKDNDPQATVEKIRGILNDLGMNVQEVWNDSLVENCYSLSVFANQGIPSSNGKGISPEFARASAYGEFIERMQSGLFFYKYQSINRNSEINIHTFAPDAKYMTVDELIATGHWMDYIIEAYGAGELSRESIAEYCRILSCSDSDKILTVPYYSLFEDKYVWLPVGFVEQTYISNGCCAGNTREEAWVHALSEIMERHCALRVLTSGIAAPRIPDNVLRKYAAVSKILDQLRESGELEVDVFDYSIDNDFPVVSTRIISKKTHSYRINVSADPVFEIALQRTLTEMFQGSSIHNVTKKHNGKILKNVTDYPVLTNVINQVENGTGLFTADFFADELTCRENAKEFQDHSTKNNKELLQYMLDLYKKMGKQIYIRNLSYLGFPSYKFVVPGFSETSTGWTNDLFLEYAIADEAAKTLRNPIAASNEDLGWMLNHSNIIANRLGRYNHFNRLSGIPISGKYNVLLISITRAYASYRLHQYPNAVNYINSCIKSAALEDKDCNYLQCISKYIQLKAETIEEEKIRSILYKFFDKECTDRLYRSMDNGGTPFDEFLVSCDFKNCEKCRHRDICSFQFVKDMCIKIGNRYSTFVNGQDRSEFTIE